MKDVCSFSAIAEMLPNNMDEIQKEQVGFPVVGLCAKRINIRWQNLIFHYLLSTTER